jgi:hypothetical protein
MKKCLGVREGTVIVFEDVLQFAKKTIFVVRLHNSHSNSMGAARSSHTDAAQLCRKHRRTAGCLAKGLAPIYRVKHNAIVPNPNL